MARSKDALEEVRSSCTHAAQHLAVAVDLTDATALEGAVQEASAFLGPIDVVLHVAGGGLGLREPLISRGDVEKLFSLNVAAAAEINRLVAPAMMERCKGNLVHVGSVASTDAVASVGYNTVKAGLAAYVAKPGQSFGRPRRRGHRDLARRLQGPRQLLAEAQGQQPEVVERFIAERLPRGRLAEAEELVPLIAFLCSDAAGMMGGCLVPIDAGKERPTRLCVNRDDEPQDSLDVNEALRRYAASLRERFGPGRRLLLVQAPQFLFETINPEVIRNRGYYAYPPTGLQRLAESLSGRDIEVRILDLNLHVLRRIAEQGRFDPERWLDALG
jgi:NAD(P)-dependent dehydrogenase (short-subunit alcohol dehydrogenase family)